MKVTLNFGYRRALLDVPSDILGPVLEMLDKAVVIDDKYINGKTVWLRLPEESIAVELFRHEINDEVPEDDVKGELERVQKYYADQQRATREEREKREAAEQRAEQLCNQLAMSTEALKDAETKSADEG